MRFFDLTDPKELRKLELQREGTRILRADTRRRNRVPKPKAPEPEPPPPNRKWAKLAELKSLLK
jgi:hypothetical protein